jgi:LytS/YehU family sensor histidine kinase
LGEGLQVKFNIDKNSILREIPPLTLQLLIENAIKHNIASEASPLKIWVKATKDYLVVKNILQLKKSSYSTKTGLNNLISRYKMLTEQAVEVSKSEKKFIVNVPLL